MQPKSDHISGRGSRGWVGAGSGAAAAAQPHPERRIISKIAPTYPELARRMHLQGAVKLEVGVKADGGVKSTRALGGNPVLVQAAADAVSKWKFEVSSGETVEIVQLTFQP